MKDFWLSSYSILLDTILDSAYAIQTYEDYIKNPQKKVVILRHDVDRNPKTALQMAEIENEKNILASYYFRMVAESFNPKIINKIKKLGHEIGYHYENLSKKNGDYEEAIKDFAKNLKRLRKFYPIATMCMHGSPTSKWDNRKLWEKYNYKNYGIIGEPYYDLDFNEVYYITDASRSWNNEKVTLRDKVKTDYNFSINSINDLMNFFKNDKLPDKIMLNIHPHNWTDDKITWMKILIWQNIKNFFKSFLVK